MLYAWSLVAAKNVSTIRPTANDNLPQRKHPRQFIQKLNGFDGNVPKAQKFSAMVWEKLRRYQLNR